LISKFTPLVRQAGCYCCSTSDRARTAAPQ